jgi:ParB family chromosome partitioning protein
MIAHAVAASGNWSVKPDPCKAENEAVRDSLSGSPATALFEGEAKKVRALLAPAFAATDGDEREGIAGIAGHDNDATVRVFQRLLKLKDTDVARIGAFVMAETLAAGTAVADCVGAHAKVNARTHWTPDNVFFDLLRDRQVVNGIIAEVSGKAVADKLVSAKLTDQRAALITAAAGNPKWCPGWMRFPAEGR